MPFMTGGVTFTRFSVIGSKPSMFDDSHLERLRAFALGRGEKVSASGVSCGWAAGSHVLDDQFTELKNVYPDHLLWDFWTETDRPPSELFKAYYETDLKALASGNPSGFPSTKQKREAKESARDRLEEEAKDGRFKKRKCIPVLWDSIRNEVLIGTTSSGILDRFVPLFDRTFAESLGHKPDGPLVCLATRTAGDLATALNSDAKNAELSHFTNGVQEGADCRWSLFEGQPDFLGNEFLLWLWFKGYRQTDTLRVTDGTEVTWMFSGGVRLEHPVRSDNDTINAASAVHKPQAMQALQSGYLPRKAALTLVRQNQQFSCKLNAETLAITGLKLPKPDDSVTEARARIEDRLGTLRDFIETFDLLYHHFVGLRLSSLWASERRDMAGWLAETGRKVAA
jgi:hypothetical protein